jgi:hypothetical protein
LQDRVAGTGAGIVPAGHPFSIGGGRSATNSWQVLIGGPILMKLLEAGQADRDINDRVEPLQALEGPEVRGFF